jgi:hypothetical protein
MGRLSLSMLCFAAALVVATSGHAKGGTYHHSDPYFVHPDPHKTHSYAPVVVYSAQHHHYHLTYHPN